VFALVLVGLYLLVAVASLPGLTADSRDLRPRLPVQGAASSPEPRWTKPRADTALPPYRRVRDRPP
jgi:hypothetical protein